MEKHEEKCGCEWCQGLGTGDAWTRITIIVRDKQPKDEPVFVAPLRTW